MACRGGQRGSSRQPLMVGEDGVVVSVGGGHEVPSVNAARGRCVCGGGGEKERARLNDSGECVASWVVARARGGSPSLYCGAGAYVNALALRKDELSCIALLNALYSTCVDLTERKGEESKSSDSGAIDHPPA